MCDLFSGSNDEGNNFADASGVNPLWVGTSVVVGAMVVKWVVVDRKTTDGCCTGVNLFSNRGEARIYFIEIQRVLRRDRSNG